MKKQRILAWLLTMTMVICLLPASVLAADAPNTVAEDFLNPPHEAKPWTRLWLPAAAVAEDTLRKDLQDIAALGFGGVEIVSLTFLTNPLRAEDAWGTPNWDKAMEIVADECQKLGLDIATTNGPAWPIAMPSIQSADDPAALRELTHGKVEVAAGTTYEGAVPARKTTRRDGTTKLFAVGAYAVDENGALDAATYIDLFDTVVLNAEDNAASTITWTAPEGESSWMLFSFWEQPTGAKTDGYYVVDHFGAAGAQACLDYWETTMANCEYMSAFSEIFEDSLEYEVEKEWTLDFLTIFQEQKGYDLTPYLPAIGGGSYYQTGTGPNCDFTDADLTLQIKNDYNDVLTYCYNENHLKPMEEMANKYGMTMRVQTAYNKPMNITTSAMSVGVPETEALGHNTLDFFRLMGSAVHMMDKPVYSVESAAEFCGNNSQTYEDLVSFLKRFWAGGVNRQLFHGSSYSGSNDSYASIYSFVGGNVWPGWRGFGGAITNDWNRNTDPALAADYITYIARMNSIMQKEQKVDVAMYFDTFDNISDFGCADGESYYPDGGLLNAYGYSYEFISPEVLELDSAVVTNGVLNEAGPAYKAIILHNQTSISLEDLARLTELAEAGLPLVFVGEQPSVVKYLSEVKSGGTNAQVQAMVQELLAMPNVLVAADYADVPAVLMAGGVLADAAYAAETDVLAKHTQDENGHFYYLYNYYEVSEADARANAAQNGTAYPNMDKSLLTEKTLTVTLQGEGVPYEMDAWSGELKPLAAYTKGNGSVTVTVELDKDEAKIIGLLPQTNNIYVSDAEADVEYVDGAIAVKAIDTEAVKLTLNTGKVVTAKAEAVQAPFAIGSWDLTIHAIKPAADSVLFRDSVWETIEVGAITELKGWMDLDEAYKNISGTGDYTATFTLDKGWKEGAGAYIDLGEVDDIFSVKVNGVELPMVSQIATNIDIGPWVQAGENTVEIHVASTIYNQAMATRGVSDLFGMSKLQPLSKNGLLGENGMVTVTPYTVVKVTDAQDADRVDVTVSLAGAAEATPVEDLAYEVSLTNAVQAATVTVAVELSGNVEAASAAGLNGWTVLSQTFENGILKAVAYNNTGLTGDAAILSITAETDGEVGNASAVLAHASVSAYEDEAEVFLDVVYGDTTVETAIDYHTCDVNRDGVVNQLDITRAQRFFGTADEICDVNADGMVNTADMILILNNYTA